LREAVAGRGSLFLCGRPGSPGAGAGADPRREGSRVLGQDDDSSALNQANLTGNYTVLRDLGSPRFRANNTAARLAAVFTPLHERDIDLSPIVVFEPVLTEPVSSDEQGRLKLVGYFPTRPLRVLFDLAYEPVQYRWLISDIAVNLAPWPQEAAEDAGAQGQERQEPAQ
jgi:hypothetical protein